MNKVEITVEQAEAIAFLKGRGYVDSEIICTALAGEWYNEPGCTAVESINTLDARTLVYAVDGHYTIAADIKLGDYVLYHDETALLIESEGDLALARIGHKAGKLKGYFPAKSYIKLEASHND